MTPPTPEVGVPPRAAHGPRRRVWQGGWLRGPRWCASPNHNERPPGVATDLLIVHSISLPPGVFGGGYIDDLFLNRLHPHADPSFEAIHTLRVSAHFLVQRDGGLVQYVDVRRRAWHAGVSQWRGREGCNDNSVGVELEGLEGGSFEPAQYRALVRLVRDLRRLCPLVEMVGHEHVAPGRKRDPGSGFDGAWVAQQVGLSSPWRAAGKGS